MPRPKRAIPFVTKEISLPPELVARVDLELYSKLEDRVPQGAWQSLLVKLLNQWLVRLDDAREEPEASDRADEESRQADDAHDRRKDDILTLPRSNDD